ncbi:hypothetical protein EBR96_05530, partial [bacterium]|nr:hypothetical protein [bacterium]
MARYCESENLTFNPAELKALVRYVETELNEQVRKHAFLIFRKMELSSDWDTVSEQSAKVSFARCLLQIPASTPLTVFHADEFQRLLDEGYSDYQLVDKTKEAIETQFKQFRPTLFGVRFVPETGVHLNQMLRFIGCKLYLYIRQNGLGVSLILGHAKRKKIGIFEIDVYTDEIMRTPNIPMAVAALVLEHHIMVRREALEAVYYQKWAPMMTPDSEDWRVKEDPFWNISYAIKERALKCYGAIGTEDDIERIKPLLLAEMEENIIFHEIGHTIIQETFLSMENICVGLGTLHWKYQFYDALYELLADFAPKNKLGHGAMVNICKAAKTDRNKAERMFLTYLSDIWFFDTEDEFMLDYAEITSLCMLRYFNDDLSVNFEKLEADVSTSKHRLEQGQLSLIDRIQELFLWDTDEIARMVKSATFTVVGNERSFQYILKHELDRIRKTKPAIDPNGYVFLQPLWTNMFSFISHFT